MTDKGTLTLNYQIKQSRKVKALMAENSKLRIALQRIYKQPNCRHEVEAQLGEDIWKAIL